MSLLLAVIMLALMLVVMASSWALFIKIILSAPLVLMAWAYASDFVYMRGWMK